MPLNRVIAVGASTGGVDALCTLVEGLPPGLPAAFLLVLHSGRKSMLTGILRACQPEVGICVAEDKTRIEAGRIYVAVPDHHLIVEGERLRLTKAPRENWHRPSVDVLFRTVSRAYRSRAVGVVLTGAMDDGASGIFAIKSRGGIAVIQDPADAMAAEMPRSALRAVTPDYCLPIDEIAPLLVRLAQEPVAESGQKSGEGQSVEPLKPQYNGAHPAFVCPECSGPLTQYEEGPLARFACMVGHRFSMEGLTEAHAETLERGLWAAIRIFEERAALHRLRARKFQEDDQPDRAILLLEIATQAEEDAKLLRDIAQRV